MTAQARAAAVFTAPVLILILVTVVVPTLGAFALSLTDFDVYGLADLRNVRFVALGNYAALLREPLFWRAVANTLLFAALGVPAAIAMSLAAALAIDAATLRWKPLWRLLLFAPYVTTLVAASVVWRYLLNTRTGLINGALATFGIAPVDWLGDPRFSIPAIVLFVVWKVFGYNMIVFSAALATVSSELRDAARLDGAGSWARFRHVTLPAIGPALLLAVVLSVASFLQIFTEPYVMTHGGPAGSTTTLLYFMFDQGFEWWSLGTASAVAVMLFAAVLGVTAVQLKFGKRQEWV
jgi:ABC-type sugar transport system permease subunit